MKHLIDIKDLNKDKISNIFATAKELNTLSKKKKRKILKGKTVANLFYENSTRTLVSFELAAKRLGADVININLAQSSTTKGETLKDTILTLQAMHVDAFIVRHSENFITNSIMKWLKPNVCLINAGDGNNQHPTQGLLDIYTISQHKKKIEEIKVSIFGDIRHSRVAKSLIDGLHILGNTTINLFGPEKLLPKSHEKAHICEDMNSALSNADVIVMLRIQKERMHSHNIPNLDNYLENYGLNRKNLSLANHSCIVMHPGPINREVEIASEIADNNPSVILEQVSNGVLIRQAVLTKLMS